MNLGMKLQNLRKAGGMSQEQLAAQMTVSRQAVSKWELGESNPDIEYVIQLSEIFGVSTDYLLKDEETVPAVKAKESNRLIWPVIISITSVAFVAIGLFSTWGRWYENQTANDIIGGVILQIIGLAGYFICRAVWGRVSFGVMVSMTLVGGFLPISLLSTLLFHRVMAPYPLDIRSWALFAVCYVIYAILGFVLLRKKYSKTR